MVRVTTKKLAVVAPPSTELAELVDDYVAELRARGLAERSLDMAYGTLAKNFLPWAAERAVTTAGELDQRLLEALSRDLLERRTRKGELLSRESVRTYMRTLRAFVLWAQKRGDLPALAVPMPSAPKRVLTVLTSAEMRAMEDAAVSERDKLIIALLSTTGMRLGELLKLEPKDVVKNRNGRGSETYGSSTKSALLLRNAPARTQR
jgi:integrase